ncbi:Lipid A export ATP-binding/permease protein MsbA [Polystyrenella longa]|uniref:Lipid A export ATP-binding/permease protein MsbA n=1 Tax=Polystyrenella longa TaxID=2528007 RepID=A0A518CPS1_9PLAN|nr:ABC transporter ATP-binding protein [Polystyrenella longa]QDU81226.1 Lipid A export ATP-binding/permease protein MsbA [Polystyrenella longa]
MATVEKASVKRLLAGRHFLKGQRRFTLIWAVLASCIFCLALLTLFLLLDLLHTRGSVQINPDHEAEFRQLLPKFNSRVKIDLPVDLARMFKADGDGGEEVSESSTEDSDTNDKTKSESEVSNLSEKFTEKDSSHIRLRLDYFERGILPSVWWLRNTVWGYPVASAYDRITWLNTNTTALIFLILTLVFLMLLFNLMTSRIWNVSAQIGMEVAQKLRRELYRQVLRLGPADLCEQQQQHAVELFTKDTEEVRTSVESLAYRYARDTVLLVTLVLFALTLNWLLALECLIPLGACWYLIRQELIRFRESRALLDASANKTLNVLSQSFRNTRLVRAYGMETSEHETFSRNLDRLKERLLNVNRRERWSRWFCRMLILFCASIVLILVCMKVLIDSSNLPLAAGLSLLVTFIALHWPLKNLAKIPVEKKIAGHAADRIYRYLDNVPPVSQAVGAKFMSPLANSLAFESVHYQTESGQKLLNGLDLTVKAGEKIALVSLNRLECVAAANLISRFIEPSDGRLLIDGEDISWATLESLRAEIAYVGGNDQFFTGSVFENIRTGNNSFSHSAVMETAKQARAHNFILRLPNGYETILGPNGETLTPGQRFRLGIARALLRNPALLILAEPAEPLDTDTKSRLDDAYTQIIQGRTTIFLPNRLSTVRRVDRIALIHEGKVESIGTHAELVKKSPIYRHWEYMNFNAFRTNGSADCDS